MEVSNLVLETSLSMQETCPRDPGLAEAGGGTQCGDPSQGILFITSVHGRNKQTLKRKGETGKGGVGDLRIKEKEGIKQESK